MLFNICIKLIIRVSCYNILSIISAISLIIRTDNSEETTILMEFRVENYRSFNKVKRIWKVAGFFRNPSDHILDGHGLRVL